MTNHANETGRPERGTRILLTSSFVLVLLLLLPSFIGQTRTILSTAATDLRHLLTTTPTQRTLEAYGDKTIMGYGYLEKVLHGIPDEHFFPFMRYPYYDMNAEVVFPGQRYQIDKRMLVGIDLAPQDLIENKIADGNPIMKQLTPQELISLWVFLTTWDYDQITGLKIYLKNPPGPKPQTFRATMLHSPDNRVPVGNWTWTNVPPSNPVTLHFDKPVSDVYSRGSLPFLLFIENPATIGGTVPEIARIEILGIKVQLAGYTIVRQDGKCFVALENSFLSEIEKQGPENWRHYLLNITNVPSVVSRLETSKPNESAGHV